MGDSFNPVDNSNQTSTKIMPPIDGPIRLKYVSQKEFLPC